MASAELGPPRPETFTEKPRKVEYGTNRIKYKHYGLAMERMIIAAGEMPDGDEKNKLRQDMLEYCKLDTEAMVRIFEAVKAL